MNKVKYPDKKVIQQQICTIIDRSGMFDEQQDSQMFTEIKPNTPPSYRIPVWKSIHSRR